jgi:hypothetical protein
VAHDQVSFVSGGCARLQSMHIGTDRLHIGLVTSDGSHTIDLPATPPQVAALRHLHGPRSDCPAVGPAALTLLRQLADHTGVALLLTSGELPVSLHSAPQADWDDALRRLLEDR